MMQTKQLLTKTYKMITIEKKVDWLQHIIDQNKKKQYKNGFNMIRCDFTHKFYKLKHT